MPGVFESTEKPKSECDRDDNAAISENSSTNTVNGEEVETRERTQTDVLNNHLLKSLLQRMNCGEMDEHLDGQERRDQEEEFV
ncbi:uncharacterized protein LOC132259568 [Phlebotomus argentipes]|uniref:uncharacterized protein LOC132259568 n=1 Tax=Phlebotomus argentipes TaxID=94469 RepID=UPI0028937FA5|nr:uncharacterized protein LOC132259568 [Phlebotomus argentipes]